MNMKEGFDIPVALILFKRKEKPLLVLGQIAKVKPKKLYLLSDGGRTPEEILQVEECRRAIESAIDWDCEVIKRYAESNIGVYENIAGGAKWVFEREEFAIFLEDDNFPDLSFFEFCEILLRKYKDNSRILWVCGTNYLGEYKPADGSSYVFTRCMLPCGWASWSHKFLSLYDGCISKLNDSDALKNVRGSYLSNKLFHQELMNWKEEKYRFVKNGKPSSWDFQMSFAVRANEVFGISPEFNLIKNIGVDEFSAHGGVSLELEMTRRFCEINTSSIKFPLRHPKNLEIDPVFERKTENIMTYPFRQRTKRYVAGLIKRFLNMDVDESLTSRFKLK